MLFFVYFCRRILDNMPFCGMKCSVVILNWNGAKMLREYLPSVIQHTPTDGVEIVVADNGSTDDSVDILQRAFPDVRLILLERNYGFAEGYNRAIAGIDSEYVVLLNSDVRVKDDWLTPLLDYMDAHEKVAAVQPKVLSDLRPTYFEHAGAAGGYMDRLCYPYCRGRMLSNVEEDKGQYDTVAPVFWTTGCCMCARTRIYNKVGGLDARFFAHMEEIDLCWRLQCRGYELKCVPQSRVYHLGGGSLQYESPRKTYLNFRNCLLMIYKNMPMGRLWGVMAARFVLDYLAALHLLVQGKPRNMWAVVQARWDFLCMRHFFRHARKDNQVAAQVPYPAMIAQRSILLDYYLKHKIC